MDIFDLFEEGSRAGAALGSTACSPIFAACNVFFPCAI